VTDLATQAVAADSWPDALAAATLLAVAPHGLGGAVLRGAPGPARERWLAAFRTLLPEGAPFRKLPPGAPDGRLLGALDIAATLAAGRPVAARGLLAEADGGVLLAPMAERLSAGTAAHLAGALDIGAVALQRDGLALRLPTRFALVLLDEGVTEEEVAPAPLLDRLAFHVALDGAVPQMALPDIAVSAARARLPGVTASSGTVEAFCAAGLALGIASLRAPMLALVAARAAAALAGRDLVTPEDAALAARLVLAPRATRLPEPAPEAAPEPQPSGGEERRRKEEEGVLEDVVLAAARAAIPPGTLARLALNQAARRGAASAGRAGELRASAARGRPAGTRPGDPRAGHRLAVVETLRAAAPWQRLRGAAGPRVKVRREDFRIARYKRRSETTAVFVVDASGSAAAARLAEAKGAVELLLGECYARRDRVALIAFRGAAAELLLPPTSSLLRVKRGLAALPGGGGTPLAAGLDAARELAEAERRRGRTPLVVLLTDGRANIARDGQALGRRRAEEDALEAARRLALEARTTALVVDTAPRPQPFARQLAEAMRAPHLPLPHADPAALGAAVRAAR
jgi:magnesium chelatase subunit D